MSFFLARRDFLNSRNRRAAMHSGFSPLQLTGLIAWYRSDLGITLNAAQTKVQAWADQSPNHNDLQQLTGNSQPIYSSSGGPNNLPYLSFNGPSNHTFVKGASFNVPADPSEYWCVCRWNGTLATTPLCDLGSTTHGVWAGGIGMVSDGLSTQSFEAVGPTHSFAESINRQGTGNTDHVVNATLNGTSSRLNIDNGTDTTGNLDAATRSGFQIGHFGDATTLFTWSGLIYEFIVCPTLTAAQRQRLASYSLARYGVA